MPHAVARCSHCRTTLATPSTLDTPSTFPTFCGAGCRSAADSLRAHAERLSRRLARMEKAVENALAAGRKPPAEIRRRAAKIVRRSRSRNRRRGIPDHPDPTPAEIEAACAALRPKKQAEEMAKERARARATGVQLQVVAADDLNITRRAWTW